MALEKTQRRAADIFICSMMSVRKVKTLKKPQFELGELMELWGKAAVLEKLLGLRQVLKLNKLRDMSPQPKNLFTLQTFNGDKYISYL